MINAKTYVEDIASCWSNIICLMNRPYCSEWQNDQLKVLSFPVAFETRGDPRRHFWSE